MPMRKLRLLHFNDVYEISNGAASKFVTTVSQLTSSDDPPPLILFSGDCYSPSLMSVITKGSQMPPILSAIGVHAACFGNHEFDWGLARAEELCAQCAFPCKRMAMAIKTTTPCQPPLPARAWCVDGPSRFARASQGSCPIAG